jgi:hypothetical protein
MDGKKFEGLKKDFTNLISKLLQDIQGNTLFITIIILFIIFNLIILFIYYNIFETLYNSYYLIYYKTHLDFFDDPGVKYAMSIFTDGFFLFSNKETLIIVFSTIILLALIAYIYSTKFLKEYLNIIKILNILIFFYISKMLSGIISIYNMNNLFFEIYNNNLNINNLFYTHFDNNLFEKSILIDNFSVNPRFFSIFEQEYKKLELYSEHFSNPIQIDLFILNNFLKYVDKTDIQDNILRIIPANILEKAHAINIKRKNIDITKITNELQNDIDIIYSYLNNSDLPIKTWKYINNLEINIDIRTDLQKLKKFIDTKNDQDLDNKDSFIPFNIHLNYLITYAFIVEFNTLNFEKRKMFIQQYHNKIDILTIIDGTQYNIINSIDIIELNKLLKTTQIHSHILKQFSDIRNNLQSTVYKIINQMKDHDFSNKILFNFLSIIGLSLTIINTDFNEII